jgi:hypothetical protein
VIFGGLILFMNFIISLSRVILVCIVWGFILPFFVFQVFKISFQRNFSNELNFILNNFLNIDYYLL